MHPCMAGWRRCLKFSTAQNGEHHFGSVISSGARNGSKGPVSPGPCGTHQERQNELWENLFSNPSGWWDNRLDKRSPGYPDFRHKTTKESLWLDCKYKPVWVHFRLDALDVQQQSSHGLHLGLELHSLSKKGQVDRAVDLFLRMDQQGVCPSVDMYRSLLKTCTKRKDLVQAKQLYSHMSQHGLESSRVLAEEVVSTFVKCGGLQDAAQIFSRWPHRTVFSWTTMISGYAEAGQGQQALRMYAFMREEGLEPDKYTFVSLLKACASIANLNEGKRIYADASKYGCGADLVVRTSMVHMYAKCGSLVDARHVFDELCETNIMLWNAMLTAYVHQGQAQNALQLYEQMQEKGISPNNRSFVSLFQACGMLAEKEDNTDGQKERILKRGKAFHADARKKGHDSDDFVANTLISMYGKCGSIVDARNVFDGLHQRGVVSWNAMLTAYAQQSLPEEAVQLYQQMLEEGVSPNDRTCTCLVSIYGKWGNIEDVQHVFNKLTQSDVVSWNAMLSAYADQGKGSKVLQLYRQMQDEGVNINCRTIVSALQACGICAENEEAVVLDGQPTKVWSLEEGKAIHIDAEIKGYASDVFVSSTLISMYGKCGCLLDAQNVFDGLSHCNLVSWNAMLAVHVLHGQAKQALFLYNQMQEEGLSPNNWTVVSILQACGMLAEKEECVVLNGQCIKVKSLENMKAMLADTRSKGCASDDFVGNTLVSVYGKCGSVLDAHCIFDCLLQRSTVSWNSMLTAYSQHGQAEKALQLYEQMLEDAVSPDVWTFVVALRACGVLAEKEQELVNFEATKVKALGTGKRLHSFSWRRGCNLDVFVGNSLITLYGKCRSIVDAHAVFESLPQRDVVSWNAMLAVYVEQSLTCEALQLYELMLENGISPDVSTFVNTLQACCMLAQKEEDTVVYVGLMKAKSLLMGKAVHAIVKQKGHASHIYVMNSLLSLYGKCGSIVDMQTLFDGLSERDVVSWNCMLAAFVEQGLGENALKLYRQMQQEGPSPDVRTFVSLVQACCRLAEGEEDVIADGQVLKEKTLEKGRAIHVDACRKGYDSDPFVGSALVRMYGKCRNFIDARVVFDGLSKADVVSWNAILSAYVEQGDGETCLELFREMQQQGPSPDDISLTCVLQACSITGSLTVLRQLRDTLASMGSSLSPCLASAFITACGKCASMEDAQFVFDTLQQPDEVLWNALISGYARNGNYLASLQSYGEMVVAGIKPDGITFLAILSTCCHAGLVDQGIEYFKSMIIDHGITPEIEHYVGMVDLLTRAGYFSRVEELLSTMPMPPDLAMCLCLLGACRKHGKVLLGKRAFDWAVRLQPSHVASYILMSNIYADAGLRDQEMKVKDLRREAGAWRNPGQSWIEHEEQVHTFVVGACKQPWRKQLYGLVGEIGSLLEKGYPKLTSSNDGQRSSKGTAQIIMGTSRQFTAPS